MGTFRSIPRKKKSFLEAWEGDIETRRIGERRVCNSYLGEKEREQKKRVWRTPQKQRYPGKKKKSAPTLCRLKSDVKKPGG